MKELSIIIIAHIFITMGFALAKWEQKEKSHFLIKLSSFYMIMAMGLLSILITDTIIGAVYSFIFGLLVIFSVEYSNKDLKAKNLLVYIVSIAFTTIMFIFINRFVLVKIMSLIYIYFLPTFFLYKRTKDQPIKYRMIGAFGIFIIFLAGSFSNHDKVNIYPSRQSFEAIEYMEQNYPEENYRIYSRDAMRGSKTIMTVFMESNDKLLRLEYKKGRIRNVQVR